MRREDIRRFIPESGEETLDQLLCYPERRAIEECVVDLSIRKACIQFQMTAIDELGGFLPTVTMEDVESRRDRIIEKMDPFGVATLFQSLVASFHRFEGE